MRRRFTHSRTGALEGMGLEIMVALLIVGGFSAAMYVYLNYAQAPGLGSVSAYAGSGNGGGPCFFYLGASKSITAVVLDQHGHPLPGVSVQLTGLNLSLAGETGSGGNVTFSPVSPVLPPDAGSGSLTVSATYTPSNLGGGGSPEVVSTTCTVIR